MVHRLRVLQPFVLDAGERRVVDLLGACRCGLCASGPRRDAGGGENEGSAERQTSSCEHAPGWETVGLGGADRHGKVSIGTASRKTIVSRSDRTSRADAGTAERTL